MWQLSGLLCSSPTATFNVLLVEHPCDCAPASCPPQIRDSIKALFPDRDCYTLVRPMHDERALNHLDALEPSQLRPEFSEVTGGQLGRRG